MLRHKSVFHDEVKCCPVIADGFSLPRQIVRWDGKAISSHRAFAVSMLWVNVLAYEGLS